MQDILELVNCTGRVDFQRDRFGANEYGALTTPADVMAAFLDEYAMQAGAARIDGQRGDANMAVYHAVCAGEYWALAKVMEAAGVTPNPAIFNRAQHPWSRRTPDGKLSPMQIEEKDGREDH